MKKKEKKVRLQKKSAPKAAPKLDAVTRAAREQEARELQEAQEKVVAGTGEGKGTRTGRFSSTVSNVTEVERKVPPGSSDGLLETPVVEGSGTMIYSSRKGSMTNDQLLFAAQHTQGINGKRYMPPPPPPKEVDPETARFMALREEQKKEKQKAHFAGLREKHKNDPRKTSIKRRVKQLSGVAMPPRKKKPVDPNAPRPENPYKAGTMKEKAYAHFMAHAKDDPEKLAKAIVALGATESTARGWLRVFTRYLAGGEK